ncbi:O-antigen translocase [Flavobacterium frigoris]|uniref:Lipopolysaccharide biosynthesis protein n=1 Tax=Flavobacterium frigoris (strain PS1) TaxID=1086011 RepID=H7FRJ4_FLAFP|nr:O-antigen translocase [Flavobacterium frigoris]EIA08977.1 lipopolysaccharide biosynthesis protein [Flavobacterium frigoris PS1]
MSIILKIGIGLVTSKLLAVFVGPSGMALVGNLRNFMSSLETVSTLGFQNGIVKYVAEIKKDEAQLQKFISTVFICLLIVAALLSGLLYFFTAFWNYKIFGNDFKYDFVFKALALALPWYAVSIFLVSVLNGLGNFKKAIWINSIGNAIGLLVSIVLILEYRTFGALLSIVISPALLFFVAFYFVNKEMAIFKIINSAAFDFSFIKKLSSYSLMALVSSVLGPLVFLMVRNNIIQTLDINQAGFWETMTRISTYYMLFVSTILSVYFLPKLSTSKDTDETKSVFWSFYRGILPVFILVVTIIYFARFFIIKLLFTSEFLQVESLFFWQLFGDVLKAASLILGYQFFAKRLTTAFIITELMSLGLFYFLSDYLMGLYGIYGVVMAQAVDNFVYLLILLLYFRKSLF